MGGALNRYMSNIFEALSSRDLNGNALPTYLPTCLGAKDRCRIDMEYMSGTAREVKIDMEYMAGR